MWNLLHGLPEIWYMGMYLGVDACLGLYVNWGQAWHAFDSREVCLTVCLVQIECSGRAHESNMQLHCLHCACTASAMLLGCHLWMSQVREGK